MTMMTHGVCNDCGYRQKETNPPCAKCGSGNVQETDMDKQAELEQAYWNGFRTKCAEMGVDATKVAQTKQAARGDYLRSAVGFDGKLSDLLLGPANQQYRQGWSPMLRASDAAERFLVDTTAADRSRLTGLVPKSVGEIRAITNMGGPGRAAANTLREGVRGGLGRNVSGHAATIEASRLRDFARHMRNSTAALKQAPAAARNAIAQGKEYLPHAGGAAAALAAAKAYLGTGAGAAIAGAPATAGALGVGALGAGAGVGYGIRQGINKLTPSGKGYDRVVGDAGGRVAEWLMKRMGKADGVEFVR